MLELIKQLDYDTDLPVVTKGQMELFVFRPSKLKVRFKEYDISKNFQIWLRTPYRSFCPNHLRVLIDLNLRVRSVPGQREHLLKIFDRIFYGHDPAETINDYCCNTNEQSLNNIEITAHLAQLFIVEQAYCYNRESKFDPKGLFFQGWVREFIDNPKEIDNLCMSVCKGQPAKVQYTCKENRKHKKFNPSVKMLWYIHNG